MNVFSLVRQVFVPCVSGPHLSGAILILACAARRSCVSSLGCFDRARIHCGRTGFTCECLERLLTYCDEWETCIVPCRLLCHSALSHRCGRELRVHFSSHCEVRVVSPLMSLILRQYPPAVLSMPFSMASSCTSCLFLWRCPFLLMRFVIFPSDCAHVHSHYQLVFGNWKRHAS